ncbi:MAG: DNA mismatch repair endonuclease MutL [Candidatus Bipolaricaulia bacterium]
MKVKQLDRHLVNKIAAGEVIERPASVVKELVENSIDAGAQAIDLHVETGGKSLVRVSDDGEGMVRDDLTLAIERHTTSKISDEADLERIHTLGFRGEALASIVEISKTRIISKSDEDLEATELTVNGGEVASMRPAARGRGTTVEVNKLFFNTPARRKYLRTDQTEFYHISRIVKRFILSHPEIHFRLFHDSRRLIDSPTGTDLREKIADLYDAETARSLIEVGSGGRALRVHGSASPPSLTRANRNDQFTFVNGRFVKDGSIDYAITKAYEGTIPKNRYPIAFIFIEIDPQMVDVNVHPKKEAVRFSNHNLVTREVKRAISDALASQHIFPQGEVEAVPRSRMSRRRPEPFAGIGVAGRRELDLRTELLKTRIRGDESRPPAAEAEAETPEAAEEPVKDYRIVGQIHDSYIVVQTEQGFEIVDQHVAHERVLYERFLKQLSDEQVKRQRLLIPTTIELPPDKAAILEEHLDFLEERLGIGIEGFGGGTFILRDYPQVLSEDLNKRGVQDAIEAVLEAIEAEGEADPKTLMNEIATAMACRAAIKIHTHLSIEEMEHLVGELRRAEHPTTCPHGRPIVIEYPLDELERKLKRR